MISSSDTKAEETKQTSCNMGKNQTNQTTFVSTPEAICIIKVVLLCFASVGHVAGVLLRHGDPIQAEIQHIVGKGLVGPGVVQGGCQVYVAVN